MGKKNYTPCPSCKRFICFDDEEHDPFCPELADIKKDWGPCVTQCPVEGECLKLEACWTEGISRRYKRHGGADS